MSKNFSYENVLPIAPLKIAALEGCRDLAQSVDAYLAKFRKKAIRSFRTHPIFTGTTKIPIWFTAPAPALAQEKLRGFCTIPSGERICSSWRTS